MSTEQLNVREKSPFALEQTSGTEKAESKVSSKNKEQALERAPSEPIEDVNSKPIESICKNNKELDDSKEVPSSLNTSKTKAVKTIVKKEQVPGNLSPLSKKLRRDSLRTQLKRACTLALTEQPKTNPSIKTRGRRHSTGTSKDSNKKPVIKKNLRKTLGTNTLKRKRDDSGDEPISEELKSLEDIENVKDSKFRRKSNESSLSEPTKPEILVKRDKELDSPTKTPVADIKIDPHASNSPARARRSTRLSPETVPKTIVSAKRRGRPSKTHNSDSTIQHDSLSKTQGELKESDTGKSSGK